MTISPQALADSGILENDVKKIIEIFQKESLPASRWEIIKKDVLCHP